MPEWLKDAWPVLVVVLTAILVEVRRQQKMAHRLDGHDHQIESIREDLEKFESRMDDHSESLTQAQIDQAREEGARREREKLEATK